MIIAVGSSLLLSAALLGHRLGLGLGLALWSFLVGLGLNHGFLSTASFLGLLNDRLIVGFRLGYCLLGSALLLGSLSLDGGSFIGLRLCLGLLGSSLGLGSFDGRCILIVAGLLLCFALPGLLSGRSLCLLLLFFLVCIVASLLATTLLGRLLGGGVTTVLGTSAFDCNKRWKEDTYCLLAILVLGLGFLLSSAATNP